MFLKILFCATNLKVECTFSWYLISYDFKPRCSYEIILIKNRVAVNRSPKRRKRQTNKLDSVNCMAIHIIHIPQDTSMGDIILRCHLLEI